ncbi:hypothetical protein V1478_013407 [Vespula squamosa]|uniref:Uncharacterized protein n=1 Tax=Vespula squamosa TaxID=30214 RepID=A0ABD2AAR4_VESSQ
MTAESDLSTISGNGSGSTDCDGDGHSGNGDGVGGDGGSDGGDGGGMGTRSHMGGRINKNKKNDTRGLRFSVNSDCRINKYSFVFFQKEMPTVW